jgi:nicotinate-nucleotide pyrophosphorylase (carboxylating)
MITEKQFETELQLIIQNGIREDVGQGDHSSLACIPGSANGKARLLVKEAGIIAGVAFAQMIFDYVDANLQVAIFIADGMPVQKGDIVFQVEGSSQSILKAERLVLNAMQRMSAIATKTKSSPASLKTIAGVARNLLRISTFSSDLYICIFITILPLHFHYYFLDLYYSEYQ